MKGIQEIFGTTVPTFQGCQKKNFVQIYIPELDISLYIPYYSTKVNQIID